ASPICRNLPQGTSTIAKRAHQRRGGVQQVDLVVGSQRTVPDAARGRLWPDASRPPRLMRFSRSRRSKRDDFPSLIVRRRPLRDQRRMLAGETPSTRAASRKSSRRCSSACSTSLTGDGIRLLVQHGPLSKRGTSLGVHVAEVRRALKNYLDRGGMLR